MRPVYLDCNATTPVSSEALEAMRPYLRGQYGNPLTSHRFGEAPRGAVESARDEVLALFGATSGFRALFNSGATEGLNHALKGLAFAALRDGRAPERRRIVIGGLEHYAVTRPAAWLAERLGFEVVRVAPGRDGVVPESAFLDAVTAGPTLCAALMWASNELGTLQPVEPVGRACRELRVPFVCDAVQVAGKLDASGGAAFADVLAISAHKLYGPKGVGALLVRDGVALDPLIHGAQQEWGLRGGTHNVAGIAGLGAAASAARKGWRTEAVRVQALRDQLWRGLHQRVEAVHRNGAGAEVLPNTLNVSFEGCPSHALCAAMDARGFAISAGAACLSGQVTGSKALLAMGLSESRALTSVRISLGHETSAHDVAAAVEAFAGAAAEVRAKS